MKAAINVQPFDWQKSTIPLQYIWDDLEHPIYELSEIIFPGQQSAANLQNIRQDVIEIADLSNEQFNQYERVLLDAPTDWSGSVLDQNLTCANIITNECLLNSVSQVQTQEQLTKALSFLLGYILGLRLSESQQPDIIQFKPDVVLQRALRIGQNDMLFSIITKFYTEEAKTCCEQLEKHIPENNNASSQVSTCCSILCQIIVFVICANNIARRHIQSINNQYANQLKPLNNQYVQQIYKQTCNVVHHLSGVLQDQLGLQKMQTFSLLNARCYATVRFAILLRHSTLYLLGYVQDFKHSDIVRKQKVKAQALSTSSIEKTFRHMPCPKFYGFVNQQSAQLQRMREQLDYLGDPALGQNAVPLEPINLLFDPNSPVQYPYGQTQNEQQQISENMQSYAQHMNTIETYTQRGYGAMIQEVDQLTKRKEGISYALYTVYPDVKCKGTVDGLETVHAAGVSMLQASDCRNMNQRLQAVQESQNGQNSSLGWNTTRYMGAGLMTQQVQDLDPLQGQTTTLLYDRLQKGLCQQFNYCGRYISPSDIMKMVERCAEPNFAGLQDLNIDKRKYMDNIWKCRSLDLDSAILGRKFSKNYYQQTLNDENILARIIDVPDLLGFLSSIRKILLCSLPGTADTVHNKILQQESGTLSNNTERSLRHVREVVLKSLVHYLLLLVFHAKQSHPLLHRYVQRMYQSSDVLDAISCVLALPLGTYCSALDQRDKQYGTCLFKINLCNYYYGVQATNSTETLKEYYERLMSVCDASEYLLQRQIEVERKPLNEVANSRRLFIAIGCGKLIYGAIMHARHRQSNFVQRYNRISSSYLSGLLQSANKATSQDNQSPQENEALDKTVRRGGLQTLGIRAGSQRRTAQYDQNTFESFENFLLSDNARNNPRGEAMNQTAVCLLPGLQLQRINCVSAVITSLKLAQHALQAAQRMDDGGFENSLFSNSKDHVIRLGYQLGTTIKQVDSLRWSRPQMPNTFEVAEHLELRALVNLSGIISQDNMAYIHNEILRGSQQSMDSTIESLLSYCGTE